MQINDSRLFKATRRTIRAEVTLIIVIVISFSWSAYALYKLFANNSDSSLFGINFSSPSPPPVKQINSELTGTNTNSLTGRINLSREPSTPSSDHHQVSANLIDQQQYWDKLGADTTPTAAVSQNLSEQLATYKKQILKELLARQRRLLIDGTDTTSDTSGDKLVSSYVSKLAPSINHRRNELMLLPVPPQHSQHAVDIENLKQWRGGYKLPSSLDNLFDTRQQQRRQLSDFQVDRLPQGSINAHSVARLRDQPNGHLVRLTGAPSLMQLTPTRPANFVTPLSNHDHELGPTFGQQNSASPVTGQGQRQGEEALDNDNGRQLTAITTEAPQPALASEENLAETSTVEPIPSTTTTISPSEESSVADAEDGDTDDGARDDANDNDSSDKDSRRPATGQGSLDEGEHEPASTQSDGRQVGVAANNHEPEPNNQTRADDNDSNNTDNDDDDASMERVKNTVHAIDEEVDRMTQPSLGMASQQEQDKSFDLKNIVQFDDNLSGLSAVSADNKRADKKKRTTRRKANNSISLNGADLQVADDRNKPPVSRVGVAIEVPPPNQQHQIGPLAHVDQQHHHENQVRRVLDDLGAKILKINSNRPGTSEGKLTINATNSGLETRQSSNLSDGRQTIRKRFKRSLESNLIKQTLDLIDAKSKKGDHGDDKRKGRKKKKSSTSNRSSSRRSDDDDEGDGEDDEAQEQDEGGSADSEGNGQNGEASGADGLKHNYQYITSNDPSLQELLAHKQLLDALQQSQLPAPVSNKPLGSAVASLDQQQQRLNSTFIGPPSPSSASNEAVRYPRTQNQQQHLVNHDREPAHTHYTVDHGILLSPASDDEHEHHSMSKKSAKSSDKKNKKKVTVAVKKGGHKKKKHKKEEKKYMKENKFKGAKKGKKMAKGKGGKGGNKGKKFYKDKGFKKKGFKNIYVKNEFGQKKEYFDEFRDKDFKKKWKNFDDKYKYAQMKKWQAKDVKGAKKMKDHSDKFKKYDKGKWKKQYHKHQASESAKKKKKFDEF